MRCKTPCITLCHVENELAFCSFWKRYMWILTLMDATNIVSVRAMVVVYDSHLVHMLMTPRELAPLSKNMNSPPIEPHYSRWKSTTPTAQVPSVLQESTDNWSCREMSEKTKQNLDPWIDFSITNTVLKFHPVLPFLHTSCWILIIAVLQLYSEL